MNNEETAMETRNDRNMVETEGTRPGAIVAPLVDIYENEEAITLVADMPGVNAQDLTIDLNENVLTLTGHRPERGEQEEPVAREYSESTFQRKFTLSNSIDQSSIDAKLEHGVLELRLPKAAKAKVRKITVQGA